MKKGTISLLIALLILVFATPVIAEEGLLPWEGEEIVYQGVGSYQGMDDNHESMIYKEWLSRLGNVRIEWTLASGNDWSTKLSIILNSGSLPDILWAPTVSTVTDYADYGYFLNLADYSEYMPNWTRLQSEFPALTSANGKNGEIWAVGDVEPYDFAHEGFYVNLTNLNALGLDMPETWDEFIDAMIAYKEMNPDSTPYLPYWSSVINTIMWSVNGYTGFFYDTAADKWDHALLNDEVSHYKQIISIAAEMYQNGLINTDYLTMSTDQKKQVLLNGDWLFGYLTGSCIENYAFQYGECPYEYGLCAAPKASEDSLSYNKVNYRSDLAAKHGYFVSAKVKNPELMASILDYIISDEASTLFNWGIEGTTFEYDENGQKMFINGYDDSDKMREAGIRQFTDVRLVMSKDRMGELVAMSDREGQLYIDLNLMYSDGVLTAYIPARETPTMDAAAVEENAVILTPVNTYVSENIAKFIDGTRSLDEWDDFVAEVLNIGDLDVVLDNYEEGTQIIAAETRNFISMK